MYIYISDLKIYNMIYSHLLLSRIFAGHVGSTSFESLLGFIGDGMMKHAIRHWWMSVMKLRQGKGNKDKNLMTAAKLQALACRMK